MADDIKILARNLGIKPSVLSGQNFLVDDAALSQIVSAAAITGDDNILEIGPGFGALTEKMLKAKKVLAVEQDPRLYSFLRRKFRGIHNLEILNDNILALDNKALAAKFNGQKFRIVANIPYSITGKIMSKFVSDTPPKPQNMCILTQKEVAERICSARRKTSLLSISIQLYGNPNIEFFVSKKSFWPIPKVDSAFLNIANIKVQPLYPIRDTKLFWRIVKIGFSSPRKQVHNNLSNGLKLSGEAVRSRLRAASIDPSRRPEDISLADWVKLTNQGF